VLVRVLVSMFVLCFSKNKKLLQHRIVQPCDRHGVPHCVIIARSEMNTVAKAGLKVRIGHKKIRHTKDEVLINIQVQELYKISYKHSKSTSMIQ
jgi:hypothetical protein